MRSWPWYWSYMIRITDIMRYVSLGFVHYHDFMCWKTWTRHVIPFITKWDCEKYYWLSLWTRSVELLNTISKPFQNRCLFHVINNVSLTVRCDSIIDRKTRILNTILLLTPKRVFYCYDWLQNTYSVVPGKLLLLTVKHD